MTMNRKKDFDCVEMQDQGALCIHEAMKGRSREDELAYWKSRSEEARQKYPHPRKLDEERGMRAGN